MHRGDRGMVTVETALATLFLAGALALAILVGGAAFVLGQCQGTAKEVARQSARGDAAAVARATADAPAGAQVVGRREGGASVVEVTWHLRLGSMSWPLVARAQVLEER